MNFDLAVAVAQGESVELEFKTRLDQRQRANGGRGVPTNGSGGVLLVGVEDDGTVTGARPRHGSITDPHRLAAMIQNLTGPAHGVEVSLVDDGDNQVIVVEVPAAAPGPIATKGACM